MCALTDVSAECRINMPNRTSPHNSVEPKYGQLHDIDEA